VTGDTNTTWGARRAGDGHPAPFPLRYVEIGNEDYFDRQKGSYDARFTAFYDAIKAKYPNLLLINSAGFSANALTTRTPDVDDDHYYRGSDEMATKANDYDSRRRNGPKVFVGEWATRVGSPTPNMEAAIADAANMAGLERNADLVMITLLRAPVRQRQPGRHAVDHRPDRLQHDVRLRFSGVLGAAYIRQSRRGLGSEYRGFRDSLPRVAADAAPYRWPPGKRPSRGRHLGSDTPDTNAHVHPGNVLQRDARYRHRNHLREDD
jgi:hypothetical protein